MGETLWLTRHARPSLPTVAAGSARETIVLAIEGPTTAVHFLVDATADTSGLTGNLTVNIYARIDDLRQLVQTSTVALPQTSPTDIGFHGQGVEAWEVGMVPPTGAATTVGPINLGAVAYGQEGF